MESNKIIKNEWKSSNRLTDEQIKLIFSEMDEKGCGYITIKEIEKRFIRFGKEILLFFLFLSFSFFFDVFYCFSLFFDVLLFIFKVYQMLQHKQHL